MSSALAEQALDIWLIQDAITSSFRFKDFSKCVHVCKAWNRIFTPVLWKVIQFGRDERQLHEHYLLNSNSILLRCYSHLVQEITIQSYLPLLAVRGSKARVIFPGADEEPVFPALRVLKWWPFPNRGEQDEDLQVRTMDMIRFIELHSMLEDIWLDQLALDESIFERLCQVIENHSSLKRVSITNHRIHSLEHIQRFLWACRRLDGNNLEEGGGGRINSYRAFHVIETGCAVHLNFDFDQPPLQGPPLDQKWTLESTRIRSLCMGRVPQQSISEILPIFRMCLMLRRLELETGYPGMMVSALRDVLHESCPNLSYLKLKKMREHDPPMNWALDLLYPETMAANDLRRSCGGFRLRSLYLQDPFTIGASLTDIPRPLGALADHHASTMVELDLSSIMMPLPEFVGIPSLIPGLKKLKGRTIWTTASSDTLGALANMIKDTNNGRQDPTFFESSVYDVGLKPWVCCGLSELEMVIYIEKRNTIIEMHPSDLLVREYLVQEISQLQQLQKLSFLTDAPWCPILTLSSQPTQDNEFGMPFEDDLGWMNQGCLDRFSNLRVLRELKWLQYHCLRLTVQDAEWMLKHWPRLHIFHARNEWNTTLAKEHRAGFELLQRRKPGIGGRFFFASS